MSEELFTPVPECANEHCTCENCQCQDCKCNHESNHESTHESKCTNEHCTCENCQCQDCKCLPNSIEKNENVEKEVEYQAPCPSPQNVLDHSQPASPRKESLKWNMTVAHLPKDLDKNEITAIPNPNQMLFEQIYKKFKETIGQRTITSSNIIVIVGMSMILVQNLKRDRYDLTKEEKKNFVMAMIKRLVLEAPLEEDSKFYINELFIPQLLGPHIDQLCDLNVQKSSQAFFNKCMPCCIFDKPNVQDNVVEKNVVPRRLNLDQDLKNLLNAAKNVTKEYVQLTKL